jgi:3-deoxy-D-manno-octulosonate 8-phosphate phosphatase (KDO 8-P phosphatase)
VGKKSKEDLLNIARHIKLVILDVDGVLTDGSIMLDNEENEFKSFHVRDGHGIKMLKKAGLIVAMITGRYSQVVERRARELGITDVYQNCHDKMIPYRQLLEKYSVDSGKVAYIGDDIVDLPLLHRAGFSIAVADAAEEAKAAAMMITKSTGGRGAVREISDFLLKAKGLWEGIIDEYSQA